MNDPWKYPDFSERVAIDPKLLQKSALERIELVAELASKLDLNDAITITHDLHKAHKGERITEPHLNPIIWELEKQFFDLFSPKNIISDVISGISGRKFLKALTIDLLVKSKKPIKVYNTKGQPLSEAELARLDEIISRALNIPMDKVREIILKSAIAGKMTGSSLMGEPVSISLKNLPRTLQDAIKFANLTYREVRAIKFAWNFAGINITNVQNRVKGLIKQSVINGLMNRIPPRALANKMYNELGKADNSLLNRDWERVAITETNRASNDGFIAGKKDGDYVLGNSHHDACPYCMRDINKKIYRVTTDPPKDYSDLDPKSKEYKRLAYRWETEVWVGKSNVGRSLSPRKRVDGKLIPRKSHELAAPTLPLHPTCRCRWTSWIPSLYYLKDGRVEFVIDEKSKEEHAIFLRMNPHIVASG